ncbi:MAG: hypothetical protein RLZZ305_670 [Actinomycetota bacterium]|jgi:sortase A
MRTATEDRVPEPEPTVGGRPARVATGIERAGRFLLVTGLLLLAFVAYRVWGTGIRQQANQSDLERKFREDAQVLRNYSSQVPELPLVGDAIGKINIPAIELNVWLVAGAKLEQLERGPGVFAGSPLPGQVGNVAIAGHRESFGGPFEHLDVVKPGDEVIFTTQQGTFTYRVTGSRVVSANEVGVIRTEDPSKAILTLVTCHPKWTSDERLIVRGELIGLHTPLSATPVAVVNGPATVSDGISTDTVGSSPGWFHDPGSIIPTVVFAALCALLWWAARRLAGPWSRNRRAVVRSTVVWLAWAPFSGVSLFFAFEGLSGLLPSSF